MTFLQKLPLLIIFILVGLASLAGVGVYAAYCVLRGPIWLRNQFIGLWLALLLFFYSMQSIYLLYKNANRFLNFYFFVDLCYFILAFLGSVVITVCYGINVRVDSIIWGVAMALVNLANIAILIFRRVKWAQRVERPSYATTGTGRRIAIDLIVDANKNDSCCITFLRILNTFLKLVFLTLLGLVASGAVQLAVGTLRYPARGKFVDVGLEDQSGRQLRLHYLCDGANNDSFPVLMLESDSTRSYADLLGLQSVLTSRNIRSCIWDKSGVGYSSFQLSDLNNHTLYYHNLIRSMGEKPPFIFVGWGGGAQIIFDYAFRHPEMFHSMTFIDAYPLRFDWISLGLIKNLTKPQIVEIATQQMKDKYLKVYLTNAFLIPFGLAPIYLSADSFYPRQLLAEKNWFYFTEKTWATYRYSLDQEPYVDDAFLTLKINQTLRINHIMSVKSDQQVVALTCARKKLPANSSDCVYEIFANRFSILSRTSLVKLSGANGKIVSCTNDECDADYFVYKNPDFTADSLKTLYSM